MQLVPHGPDVPAALLHAHEEGRVVFFCGAGISCAAGLPTFKKMVREIFRAFHTPMEPDERTAFSNKHYDEALGLLEKRLQDEHLALREILPRLLRPRTIGEEALRTHDALLHLGRTADGTLRLVTTNFDDLFETAARRAGLPCPSYSAPTLPLPLPRCWDGLVYLHGKLHEDPTPFEMSNLILTDGDFGRAYLMEGWAARFTSMLLHNWEVCFIGYSIEDQVVRYMLNALDADKRQGLPTRRVWAFRDNESPCDDWIRRGVTPIVYSVAQEHLALHHTLREWARLYRGGTSTKIEIVESDARRPPGQSNPDDDFAGRLLWALADRSGLPLRRFTTMEPPPSIDWFRRLRPLFDLSDGRKDDKDWKEMVDSLSPWLLRFADDERLVIRFAMAGGSVGPAFREGMEDLLSGRGRGNSPAIGERVRILWRLLLSGRMIRPSGDVHLLVRCLDRMERDGLARFTEMEFRELLTPYVRLRSGKDSSPGRATWEVALPFDDIPGLVKGRSLALLAGLRGTLEGLYEDARGLGEDLARSGGTDDDPAHAPACLELASVLLESRNALLGADGGNRLEDGVAPAP